MLDVRLDFFGSSIDEKDVGNEWFKYPLLFAVYFLVHMVLGKVGFRPVLGQVSLGLVCPCISSAKHEPMFRGVRGIPYRHPCW